MTESARFGALKELTVKPKLFGVGRPLVFNVPVMLGPVLVVPFVLAPMVLTVLACFIVDVNLIPLAGKMGVP